MWAVVVPEAKVSVPDAATKSSMGVAGSPVWLTAVVQGTVTVRPLAVSRVTVKRIVAPSVAPESPILSCANGSSSAMVPTPVPSSRVASVGSASRSQNVSVCSSRASSGTATVTVADVARAGIVSLPATASKSWPGIAAASPPKGSTTAEYPTVTGCVDERLNPTVNVAVEPSAATGASETDTAGRASSSRISTDASSSPSSARLLGEASTSRNVSGSSTTSSLTSATDTVLASSPAAKVSVCAVAAM